ncbi:MAG: lipoyl(octanoyl) transferase LipB [Gemmatimonadaceae bacterium]|nr:lipoyl(octanoyl) transferase LipB [Gemmatimonadaceae bacterium]
MTVAMEGSDAQDGDRLLLVHDLGVVAYDDAWAYQREMARRRVAGEVAHDVLILCEHPPVITVGRRTKPGHLLASEDVLRDRGIALREVERGGDITVHEPGQLVAYPIVDLKRHRQDLHWYLRQLEAAIIETSAALGVSGTRRAGLTGVWCGDDLGGWRKLASIGVHARDWVTWHGLALNVINSLETFQHVVPCGIPDAIMTSLAREGATLAVADADLALGVPAGVKQALALELAVTFGLRATEDASL